MAISWSVASAATTITLAGHDQKLKELILRVMSAPPSAIAMPSPEMASPPAQADGVP
jgi:hypothetical protein